MYPVNVIYTRVRKKSFFQKKKKTCREMIQLLITDLQNSLSKQKAAIPKNEYR